MISLCANPDCGVSFDYRQGRFFRFHKSHTAGDRAPNTHSVQHFWLCGHCCGEFTLEYQDGAGVLNQESSRYRLRWGERKIHRRRLITHHTISRRVPQNLKRCVSVRRLSLRRCVFLPAGRRDIRDRTRSIDIARPCAGY